jgi:hypothetical protein
MRTEFQSEKLKGKGQSGDLGANGRIILKYMFKSKVEILHRIYSNQDTIQCPAIVNIVMDIRFSYKAGKFLDKLSHC